MLARTFKIMDLMDLRLALANSRRACQNQADKFKNKEPLKWTYSSDSWENLAKAYDYAITELEKTDEWKKMCVEE